MKVAKFRSGYKYQLQELYSTGVEIIGFDLFTSYIALRPDGDLSIYPGYAWDGATWCPDFDWIIRGSLIHDALYQLMRLRQLPPDCKPAADAALRRACLADGAWRWQAEVVHRAVTRFGGFGIDPARARPLRQAPP